ncbi:MAG: phosphatase PAP2 family protein [Sphingomonas bacterium]|nr:phosphatase PAP2 family protein [Sphingomonas bacterium]
MGIGRTASQKCSALAIAAALVCATPASAAPAGWAKASDLVRSGLVIGAVGIPAADRDWRGAEQDAIAMAVAGGATAALKYAIHERRPDGSDDNSFPSGHTSISFAAAAGLEQRFGWKVGIPAHLAAAFVGLARVKADKHYWHDVLVGAAIGEAAGLLLVDKHRNRGKPPIGAGLRIAF